MIVKRVLLRPVEVQAASRPLTLRERIYLDRWVLLAKAVLYGVIIGVCVALFLNANEVPSRPEPQNIMEWIAAQPDYVFILWSGFIYLFMLGIELIALPRPLLIERVEELNAEALEKLNAS